MKYLLLPLLLLAPSTDMLVLKRMLRGKDRDQRVRAVRELSARGDSAKIVHTELHGIAIEETGLLQEETVRILLATEYDFGETVAEAAGFLADEDAGKRESAAHLLALIGSPAAKGAAPALVAVLTGESERVRAAAASALSALDHETEKAYAELALAAASKDAAVRAYAAEGYGWAKSRTKDALAALATLLKDRDPYVRLCAAKGYRDLGVKAKNALIRLRKARKDKDAKVRGMVAAALGRLGKHARAAVKDLIAMMADKDEAVRFHVAGALHALREFSFPLLMEALEGEKKAPKLQAVEALARFGPDGKAAVPELVKLAKVEDRDFQLASLRTLGDLGAAAKDALPDLRLLAHQAMDRKVKKAAKEAMLQIEAALR
jgi:HEAT repeat protein